MPVDPVCSMDVTDTDATVTRDGVTYHFRSAACRDLFERRPEQYLQKPHPHLEAADGVSIPRRPAGRASGSFDLEIDDPGALGVGDHVSFTKTVPPRTCDGSPRRRATRTRST